MNPSAPQNFPPTASGLALFPPESAAIDNFSKRKIMTIGNGSTLGSNCVAACYFSQCLEESTYVFPSIGSREGFEQ